MTPRRAALVAWATRVAHELADILELADDATPEQTRPKRHGRRTPQRPVVTEIQREMGLRLAREMGIDVDEKKAG